MNELRDLKYFCNCFHDGEIFKFFFSEAQIKIFMESSPLFFTDEEIPEKSKKLLLTSENTLKGLFYVKKYTKITINNFEVETISNDFDVCEVLDLSLTGNSIELNLNKLNYTNNNVDIKFFNIVISNCDYDWIDFNKINENEYPGDKDDFFDNIRDLMGKPQI